MNNSPHPEIWTDEQVAALNACQSGYGHPFTCGSGSRSDPAHVAAALELGHHDPGTLVATRQGWVCPACDYRQFWAHPDMFLGPRPNPLDLLSGEDDSETS